MKKTTLWLTFRFIYSMYLNVTGEFIWDKKKPMDTGIDDSTMAWDYARCQLSWWHPSVCFTLDFYTRGKVEENFLIPEITTVDSNYQLTAFNCDFIWFQKEETKIFPSLGFETLLKWWKNSSFDRQPEQNPVKLTLWTMTMRFAQP